MRSLLILFLLVGCGGGGTEEGGRTTADSCPHREPASLDLADRLRAAPCVSSVVELGADHAGYRAFAVTITQLVDHQDAASGTFDEHLTIQVADEGAPTILETTGYWDYVGQNLEELTSLLHGNQIAVEHRYFADSIPADPDWSQLTIANAADDSHQIVAAFQPLLTGPWISTGASKGGMTSVYHRRFWPDDVDGTVPYVAPLSFGAPDPGYDDFVHGLGTPACRQALEDLEVDLLTNRRAMLEQRATDEASTDGYTYDRIPIGPATESAVTSIYWAFWQYAGIDLCGTVPPVTATDDDVWSWLQQVSAVNGSSDQQLAYFDPYYYQAEAQLGYPAPVDPWLDGITMYGEADYDGIYPVGVAIPAYDPAAMQDIDAWVQGQGDRLMFVYGEWDPWSGGKFRLGDGRDEALYVQAQGTHGSSLGGLAPADRAAAMQTLADWTGVTPAGAALRRARPAPPHVPPAVLRAWRLGARPR